MAINNPRGFQPHRHLNGAMYPHTRRYPVSADNALHVGIAKGDPVRLIGGSAVKFTAMSAAQAVSKDVLGIVSQPLNSNERPFTHSQPTRGPFLPSSTAGFVDVIVDPQMTYLVQLDATASQTDIGQLVDVTAGGINTAAGISQMALRHASVTATTTFPFRIIGLADTELDGNFGVDQDVEVVIANHPFADGKGGT